MSGHDFSFEASPSFLGKQIVDNESAFRANVVNSKRVKSFLDSSALELSEQAMPPNKMVERKKLIESAPTFHAYKWSEEKKSCT